MHAPSKSPTQWSAYQQAIFEQFEIGTGNLVVRARAGTGKTTTVIEAVNYIPRGNRVLLVAFNKAIQTELASRAPRHVDVKTLHGAGFAILRRAFGSVQVDENKTKLLATKELIDRNLCRTLGNGKIEPLGLGRVLKLAGLAKATLANDVPALVDLALEHDIDEDPTFRLAKVAEVVLAVLERCKADTATIDFDDMVWLPVVHGLRPQSHDIVIVDEAQDMNAAQIALVRAIVRPRGRIIAVGDDRQAIYGFRGAGANSMQALVEGTDAAVLPLSITYRCPRAIVRYVNRTVPDYEAAPAAPEGEIRSVSLKTPAFDPQIGDFVISRSNAPLVRVALDLLARGKPATIAGRDIAKHLVRVMEDSKRSDVTEMLVWLRNRTQREYEKFIAADKPRKAEEVLDIEQAIQALCEGQHKVSAVVTKTQSIFADGDLKSRIICTTTHKAKGLERDRVWLLIETYSDRTEEETNLHYVAATRAKRELVLVSGVVE